MAKCSFLSKPRHVTPEIDCLKKMSPVVKVSTHIYGVSKEIDGKTFIFQVNQALTPQINHLRKTSPVMGFLRRYMRKNQQSGLDMER